MSRWREEIRDLALRLVPGPATTVLSIRSRRLSHRLVRRWGLTGIDERIVDRLGLVVADGPFAGLRFPGAARREHLGPYLAGTYELELHPWLAELRAQDFVRIIDVGAKLGYYALGLARWFPRATVLAFDTDPWARRVTRAGARLNGLANVAVSGRLRPEDLEDLVRGVTLLISDCEGCEARLLGSALPASVADTWMIVETHEAQAPGVERLIGTRFSVTHDIAIRGRDARTAPPRLASFLGSDEALRAVTEARGEQRWMFLRPRARRSSGGEPEGSPGGRLV